MTKSIRKFLFSLAIAAVASAALAQQLPDAAAERLAAARASASEALSTYPAQYPDRPLWQQAFGEVEEAISLAPDSPEPYRFQAIIHTMANWYGPAWQMWQSYLARGFALDAESTQYFVEAGLQRGYGLYQQGDLDGALSAYLGVLDQVPYDLEAASWAGRILMEQGRPQQAISYWSTVAERNPTDTRAVYFRDLARDQATWGTDAANAFREGVSFYEAGSFTEARERFTRATILNDGYAEAWAWLGRVEFEAGNYADARSHYGRAVEIEPAFDTYRYFYEEAGRRLE